MHAQFKSFSGYAEFSGVYVFGQLKLRQATSGNRASCSMRFQKKQRRWTLASLFSLRLAFYYVCCRFLFYGQFTPKIQYETKRKVATV